MQTSLPSLPPVIQSNKMIRVEIPIKTKDLLPFNKDNILKTRQHVTNNQKKPLPPPLFNTTNTINTTNLKKKPTKNFANIATL